MHELSPLFEPSGVMVVGASSSPGKLGAVMADALSTYSSDVALVNSRNATGGMHSSIAAAVASAPSGIDLAVLCVPASATAAALEESALNGVRAALVCSGGFAEIGEAGASVARDVADVVARTGIRLLGPNTSGFFIPHRGLRASFVPGVLQLSAGPVAVVAASGGVNHVLAFKLQQAGVGVSLAVGIGAGMDVNAVDVLDYLISDEETKVVALHLETVADGPALLDAVSRLSAVKPVVALVVGKNDVSEFAESHTGALATSWRTTRATLSQAGAVIADDEMQMVNYVTALSGRRLAESPRSGVGLITAQAGPGLLIADALKSARVEVPRLSSTTQAVISTLLPPLTFQANPVDTGRPGPGYDELIKAVAADPSIDVVAVYGITEPIADLPALVTASGTLGSLPVLVGIDGPDSELRAARDSARTRGIPLISGPSSLAQGIVALVDDARTQYRRQGPAESGGQTLRRRATWDEVDGKELLSELGIATPQRERCVSRDEARQAFTLLEGPVAVKIIDATVLHKSDIGGVQLGVDSPSALETALDELEAIGASEFLVESMAPKGVDLILGVRRDPVFGPIVVLGIGGVATEAIEDVAIGSLPITRRAAETLSDGLLASELLHGFRSGPELDAAELADTVIRLGGALLANPHIEEIEINPLRLTNGGLVALDAVVINSSEPITASASDDVAASLAGAK